MATGGKHGKTESEAPPHTAQRRMASKATPEWADGLKQLYDAVVEEQLPDQFLDLLAKLDEQDVPSHGRNDSSGPSDAR
jgi:hypothetical protein